ncbi:tyrosyl-DNA phosphodiesterase, partial [Saccharata proteae CBS 121410]
LTSLSRSISPPPGSRNITPGPSAAPASVDQHITPDNVPLKPSKQKCTFVPSPVQLSKIRDLPPSANIDTVCLKDLLCDPMIRELWLFDYLFDIDFVMAALDEDVRSIVQVKIIHGSWRRDDTHRIALENEAAQYSNVQLITAYMPEAFGTHHTKMMIMIRHDENAQVVIHTANMIHQDWANLSQAVWRSPLLPLIRVPDQEEVAKSLPIGSGRRFKTDLLHYLSAYGNRLTALISQLRNHDFSSVRAALIASVPSRQQSKDVQPAQRTAWGWRGLREILRTISCQTKERSAAVIVVQVSSIASLGQSNTWLTEFRDHLSCSADTNAAGGFTPGTPKLKIVYPTTDEIRGSLDGYGSGGSIHMKTQTAAQQKQLHYIQPFLHRWAGRAPGSRFSSAGKALRQRAAPHIKTYVRFADETQTRVDWAMVTSANLSTQAWGALPKGAGEVRICSYEVGVVVWPALFAGCASDGKGKEAVMVPVFGKDVPSTLQEMEDDKVVVGFRMPYDLPLAPYSSSDTPWCASAPHLEPDWKGQ